MAPMEYDRDAAMRLMKTAVTAEAQLAMFQKVRGVRLPPQHTPPPPPPPGEGGGLECAHDSCVPRTQVCAKVTPVLHFFFLARFPDPAEWYERRLAYTRSVAVNSMVGYFAGIGDRHACNILLDERSGEVVHIDFGVCFEQARGARGAGGVCAHAGACRARTCARRRSCLSASRATSWTGSGPRPSTAPSGARVRRRCA